MDDGTLLDDSVLFEPETQGGSQLVAFMRYCERRTDRQFADYTAFETFAVEHFRQFWSLFLDWSQIVCEGGRDPVCSSDDCETAVFFPELRLNYAENLLATNPDWGALIACHADGRVERLSRGMLREKVIRLANHLRQLGVQPGEIVAAIARNNAEVIIAALATAAIGAVFSSCSHDLGALTVLSRFQILKPKVLVANHASQPWDIGQPLADRVAEVIAGLPSLKAVIDLDQPLPGSDDDFEWQRFPFNHALFILFSSGTTGAPKCIMHGTGGTLLEHVKEHRLHGDLAPSDRMLFQTTCGWMMWNWQLSALACGAEIVVYDGPLRGPGTFWELLAEQQVTVFGTNPAYLQFTDDTGYQPKRLDLRSLRSIMSTGSILYPRQFDWVVREVKRLPVQSISGGTDMIGCFVLGNPLLPVYRGQAQCRSLALDVQSFPSGQPIGELICANPFPSRPVGFYGEASSERYHRAYFAANAGVWTHGDLIELTGHGAIMHGRSDGVMNIRGVRVGPAEIYRILQQIPVIVEAMAVEQTDERQPGGTRLILLVVLRGGFSLDAPLITRIRRLLSEQGNAMMVPAMIVQMQELPVTFSGKRSEAAARDAVNGLPIRNREALMNPQCLTDLTAKTNTQPPSEAPANVNPLVHEQLQDLLCRLCQRAFHLAEVKPTDNFLRSGGDSLAILSFLMEVVSQTKTDVPLHALIGVSTIADLANVLRTGVVPMTMIGSMEIRPVEARDYNEVCRFLDRGFRRSLAWQRIFDHPWQPDDVPRGFVLTDANKIVGFIGLIAATRTIAGKTDTVANLTSWYVEPEYRGWSNPLIAAATQYGISYTSLTPGRASHMILSAMGFSVLDNTKLYAPPFLHSKTLFQSRPDLITDRSTIRKMLSETDRRIFDDNKRYDCMPLVVADNGEQAFAIVARRPYRWHNYALWPYSQVIYATNPDLLRRHLERVTLSVMRHQRTVGLTYSTNSITGGISVPSQTLYRSTTFAAGDLDKLYSELVLLPV